MFAIRCVDRATFVEHRKRIRAWLGRKREAQVSGRNEDLLLGIERRQIDRWVAEQPHAIYGMWAIPYGAPDSQPETRAPSPAPKHEDCVTPETVDVQHEDAALSR